jgi:hypothetical protein
MKHTEVHAGGTSADATSRRWWSTRDAGSDCGGGGVKYLKAAMGGQEQARRGGRWDLRHRR